MRVVELPENENMNEINTETMKTFDWRELRMAKFKIAYSDEKNQITIHKGNKYMQITYTSADLYDIRELTLKGICQTKSDVTKTGYYNDMIQDAISAFFKFEFVMWQFRRSPPEVMVEG